MRTISCMVEALAPYFEFRIVTLNHDSGSADVYDSVQTNAWNQVGSAQVYYIPKWSVSTVQRIAREILPDLIYLNGFFATSSIYGLLTKKMGKLPDVPVIIASRGDLAGGALGLKSAKKRLFMRLMRTAGFYRKLRWHASSEREKSEMLAQLQTFGVMPEDIWVAPDLGFGYGEIPGGRPVKQPGEARFVTVSRISRMKNLPFALERLGELSGKVSLDIFGPVEDQELWAECQRKIATLPANVAVQYHGPVEPERVLVEMSQRHFFILPTLGENYGHVIVEAAAAGCPVVISDRTQWLGLRDQNSGWDISLEDRARWRSILQGCVDMVGEQYESMAESASRFGRSVMQSRENLNANVDLFRRTIQGKVVTGANAPSGRRVR